MRKLQNPTGEASLARRGATEAGDRQVTECVGVGPLFQPDSVARDRTPLDLQDERCGKHIHCTRGWTFRRAGRASAAADNFS